MDQRYALAMNCHEGPGRNLILLDALAASEIQSSCWILREWKTARNPASASGVPGVPEAFMVKQSMGVAKIMSTSQSSIPREIQLSIFPTATLSFVILGLGKGSWETFACICPISSAGAA